MEEGKKRSTAKIARFMSRLVRCVCRKTGEKRPRIVGKWEKGSRPNNKVCVFARPGYPGTWVYTVDNYTKPSNDWWAEIQPPPDLKFDH